MATKFLDYTGLSYLWNKIKTYAGNFACTAAKALGIHFIIPNETEQTATLTATITGITSYFVGLTVALRMPFNTPASATLNINNLGAKPIYYKVNTTSADYYPANTVVLLVYETTTLSTGCFKMVYAYDSNTNNATAQNISTSSSTFPVLIGSTANATANIGNKATYFCKDVKIQPSTGVLSANGFVGDVTGNASTASAVAWSGITDKPSTFTPSSHNQASNTINAMTGYSKPSSGSAIATTDTLNEAIGKLEYKVDNSVTDYYDMTPVGSIFYFSTNIAPAGYLVCDGSAVSRNVYSDLFNVIGTTYGSGDGSTTFNLPNLIDKFAEGANSNIGDSVTAGLPNITGSSNGHAYIGGGDTTAYGAIGVSSSNEACRLVTTGDAYILKGISFNASNSNSIYGRSNTVQPPAVKLLPCIKAYNIVSNSNNIDVSSLESELIDNVVHRTGDEVVNGVKTFNGFINALNTSVLAIRLPNVTRGSDVNTSQFGAISFRDKNDQNLAFLEYAYRKDTTETEAKSAVDLKMGVHKRDGSDWNHIAVGIDENGEFYSRAPSTSLNRTDQGNDIVTRNWIPKDTRIVHTSTDETITGAKYHTKNIYPVFTNITRGTNPSSAQYIGIHWLDKNKVIWGNNGAHGRIGSIEAAVDTSGTVTMTINAYRYTANSPQLAQIILHEYSDGTNDAELPYSFFPSIAIQRVNPTVYIKSTQAVKGTTEGEQNVSFHDKNGTWTGEVWHLINNYETFTGFRNVLINSTSYYQVGLRSTTATQIYFGPRGTGSSGTINLGQAGNYWKEVFAYSGSINTSDKRLKTEIDYLSDSFLNVWEKINWQQFKMKDAVSKKGNNARIHAGLIAQDVKDIFTKCNIDVTRYGFFCHDEIHEEIDNGVITPAYDLYALRYSEALCIEAAYQRRKNKILENRISELERQVSDMLILLQNLTNGNG